MMAFSKEQAERYSRHFVLKEIGVSGQKRLLASKVLVVGAGALGSSALLYLAAAGVGTIGIADGDLVDRSNLSRQIIHREERIGLLKTESAKQTILAINPDIAVNLYAERLTPDNIQNVIRDYDFIIDATDRFASKFLINDACVLVGKPYSHAGAVRFEGQAMTYVPGRGPCLRCVLGTVPQNAASCSEVGVLGTIPGMFGCIQATEAVKYLLGAGDLLVGRVLHIDGLSMRMQTIDTGRARVDCPVCGEHPTISSLIDNSADYEPACCPPTTEGGTTREMELCKYLETRSDGDILVDLRSETMYRFGTIPGAVNIPLERVGELYQLPKEKPVYLFCQAGDISGQFAELLSDAGYDACNLTGGYREYLRHSLNDFQGNTP